MASFADPITLLESGFCKCDHTVLELLRVFRCTSLTSSNRIGQIEITRRYNPYFGDLFWDTVEIIDTKCATIRLTVSASSTVHFKKSSPSFHTKDRISYIFRQVRRGFITFHHWAPVVVCCSENRELIPQFAQLLSRSRHFVTRQSRSL